MDTDILWDKLGNETPAKAPIMAQDPNGKVYSIKGLKVEDGVEFEGARESGPMVWLEIEEI